MKTSRSVWTVGILLAGALLVVIVRVSGIAAPRHALTVVLLSNREVAGLEFAHFVLSNRTERAVGYLRDRKEEEPSYLLIQRSVPHPETGVVTMTNHNQRRSVYVARAELPPHSGAPFTVRYPSGVTGAVLIVSYDPKKSRFQLLVEDLMWRASGADPQEKGAYRKIEVKQPFREEAR